MTPSLSHPFPRSPIDECRTGKDRMCYYCSRYNSSPHSSPWSQRRTHTEVKWGRLKMGVTRWTSQTPAGGRRRGNWFVPKRTFNPFTKALTPRSLRHTRPFLTVKGSMPIPPCSTLYHTRTEKNLAAVNSAASCSPVVERASA